MRQFKIMVYNVRTGNVWFFLKRFSCSYEADRYCAKRTKDPYIVTFTDPYYKG